MIFVWVIETLEFGIYLEFGASNLEFAGLELTRLHVPVWFRLVRVREKGCNLYLIVSFEEN